MLPHEERRRKEKEAAETPAATGPPVETISIALRNNALPPNSPGGFLELNVRVAPSPRAGKRVKVKGSASGASAAASSQAPAPAPSDTSPRSKKKAAKPLLGSFAAGPSSVWRKVQPPGDDKPYYFSEVLGVSQWSRPRAPPLHAISIAPADLRASQATWDLLTEEERLKYTYGSLRETEEGKQPPPPPQPPRQLRPAPPEDEAHAGDGDDDGDAKDGKAARLPLLSATARNQPGGHATGTGEQHSLLGPPTGERLAARAEVSAAGAAAVAAKHARLEAARRAREELEALQEKLAAKALAAAEAAGEEGVVKAPTVVGGINAADLINPAMAEKLAKLFEEPDHSRGKPPPPPQQQQQPAAEAPSASRNLAGDGGRPKPMPISQVEALIASKCAALRNDEEEMYRLARAIQQDKAEVRARGTPPPSLERAPRCACQDSRAYWRPRLLSLAP